jgi:hypothetical protein
MASSPVSQPVEHLSTCLSKKKQYDSRQEAEQFEVRNREKYDQSRQYAYACEDCNKWHLSCMSPDAVTMARVNYSRLGVGNTRGNHGETEAKVNELHAKGLDCKQIAIELNVTKAAVSYHLNKLSTSKDGRSHKSARIKLPDIPREAATSGAVSQSHCRAREDHRSQAPETQFLLGPQGRVDRERRTAPRPQLGRLRTVNVEAGRHADRTGFLDPGSAGVKSFTKNNCRSPRNRGSRMQCHRNPRRHNTRNCPSAEYAERIYFAPR